MLKIVHAADLHLDSAFSALTAEQAALMRREQRGLLDEIVGLTETVGADILLMAGDLFDTERCFGETAEAICAALARTRARVFIAPGNHDFYGPRSPWARMELPENVHVFTSPEPESVELTELGCTLWGAAFLSETAPPPLRGFRADGRGLNIMVLHGDTYSADSRYGGISEVDIAASCLDYLALGHIHKYSGPRRAGRTVYAYPGCAMGRGFDETGEKGVIIAELDGEDCRLRFEPLSGRRYEIIDLDISDAGDIAAAAGAALSQGRERDICRLVLRGERDEAFHRQALEAELASMCWKLELRDLTRPRRSLWAAAGENTLKGGFLRRMKKLYDAAESDDERLRVSRAVSFGLDALENRGAGR